MQYHVALAVLAVCAVAPTVWAADPQSISTDVPVQVEDAFPTTYGYMTLQGTTVYTHDSFNSAGPNGTALAGTLKFGPLPGLQIDIGPSYTIGSQSSANSGNATVDALYQFNKNSTYIPAFAAHVYYGQPYGGDHHSQQWTFRAIATKYLGFSDQSPRLDINLTDYHLDQPSFTQRKDQLEAIVGLSALITSDTAIVGDVVHGAKPNIGQVETIIDLGLRHTLGDNWAIGGGVGAGVAEQSPEFRVFFALQKDVDLF